MALRRAREHAGLSLKEVERLTAGRFKPSTVAGYERGERSISMSRFIALASAYGALPNGVLADAMARLADRLDRLVVILPDGEVEIQAHPAGAQERRAVD